MREPVSSSRNYDGTAVAIVEAALDKPARSTPSAGVEQDHPLLPDGPVPVRTHNTAQAYIPGNAVEEEKAAGEDIVQLIQRTGVQVRPGHAAAPVVDIQYRYWVKFASSLLEGGIGRPLYTGDRTHPSRGWQHELSLKWLNFAAVWTTI